MGRLTECKVVVFYIADEAIPRVAKFRENRHRDGGERVFGKKLDANTVSQKRDLCVSVRNSGKY